MNYCIDCSTQIGKKSTRCKKCSNIHTQALPSVNLKRSLSVSKSYKQTKLINYYTIFEMKTLLKNMDTSKYCKTTGSHRTFIKKYQKLHLSMLEYANNIKYNCVRLSLKARICLIINGVNSSTCYCGKTIKWSYGENRFQKICKCCNIKNKTKEYYKIRYGNELGIIKYNEQTIINKKSSVGAMSLKWFKDKYGEDGLKKYNAHWEYNFSKRKNVNYSKISQKLFNDILDTTQIDTNYVRFATHDNRGEMRINFNKKDKSLIGESRVCMYVDFRYKNKIIEFDGDYWHQKSKLNDDIRDIILRNKGYKVLRIKEKNFKSNSDKEIQRCVAFLDN